VNAAALVSIELKIGHLNSTEIARGKAFNQTNKYRLGRIVSPNTVSFRSHAFTAHRKIEDLGTMIIGLIIWGNKRQSTAG
jgi:hypothetical protein